MAAASVSLSPSEQQQLQTEIRRGKEKAASLLEAIRTSEARLQEEERVLESLLESQEARIKSQTSAERIVSDLRRGLNEFLSALDEGHASEEGASSGGQRLVARERSLLRSFKQGVANLRERRERDCLVETLSLLGDLHLSRGQLEHAESCYLDSVDTLLSAARSLDCWRVLLENRGDGLFDYLGAWGVWYGISVLGKLIIFCSRRNLSRKLEASLLAASFARSSLDIKLPNPRSNSGYATYTPQGIAPPGLLGSVRLPVSDLCAALRAVADALVEGGRPTPALPALAVLEYCSSFLAKSVPLVIDTRTRRISCLCKCGLVGPATSILASILQRGDMPLSGAGGAQLPGTSGVMKGLPTPSGLHFYGLPPFSPHLPPSDPQNTSALGWLMGSDAPEFKLDPAEYVREPRPQDISRMLKLMRRSLCLVGDDYASHIGGGLLCQLAAARAEILVLLGRGECSPGSGWEWNLRIRKRADEIFAELQAALMMNSTGPQGELPISEARLIAQALYCRGEQAYESGEIRVSRYHACRGLASLQQARGELSFLEGWSPLSLWLKFRCLLIKCALSQGRLSDARSMIGVARHEAKLVHDFSTERQLIRLTAQASIAQGDLDVAYDSVKSLIKDHVTQHARDLEYVAALRLLASICRALAKRHQATKWVSESHVEYWDFMIEGVRALWDADERLRSSLEDCGWIGFGVLSYSNIISNDMGYDAQPALFRALCESSVGASKISDQNLLRPDDECDTTASSFLSNLYFKEARTLLAVRTQLLSDVILLANLSKDNDVTVMDWSIHWCHNLAEELLELFRHVFHPLSLYRAMALSITGQLRRLAQPQSPLSAALAFKKALNICCSTAGHDRTLMREICFSLADLYQSTNEKAAAKHYIILGATLGEMQRDSLPNFALTGASNQVSDDAIQKLPRGTIDEIVGPSIRSKGDDRSKLTSAALLRFMLSRGREASHGMSSLIIEEGSAPMISTMHAHHVLLSHISAYAERCCLALETLEHQSSEQDGSDVEESCIALAWSSPVRIKNSFCVQGLLLLGRGGQDRVISLQVDACLLESVRMDCKRLHKIIETSASIELPKCVSERFSNILLRLRALLSASSTLSRSEEEAMLLTPELSESLVKDLSALLDYATAARVKNPQIWEFFAHCLGLNTST